MTCYLLHFDTPISDSHTCQHYLGYTDNVTRRLKEHRAGQAARLTEVAKARGIKFQLVRLWPGGDRALERRLKNRHEGPRFCPICSKKK